MKSAATQVSLTGAAGPSCPTSMQRPAPILCYSRNDHQSTTPPRSKQPAMKLSAKKMGSMKALKDSLKKGGSPGGAHWIKGIPSEGITVRFLTEPEEWFGFNEYYDEAGKTFVPMVEGEVLPDGAKPSFRYLTNALDTDNDRVIALKLPKTAANALILKYDKYDTMTDRDYELQKHGEGLDTKYDITPTSPSKKVLTKYDLIDLEKVLVAARQQATGEVADDPDDMSDVGADTDTDEDEAPARKAKPKSTVVVVVDDEDDEDEAPAKPTAKSAPAKRASAKTPAPKTSWTDEELFPDGEYRVDYSSEELAFMPKSDIASLAEFWEIEGKPTTFIAKVLEAQEANDATDDDDETPEVSTDEDDEDEDEEDEEDEVEYSEDDLRKMTLKALKAIATDMDIEVEAKASKDDLIDLIIEAAEA